jgi:hypothetical protein
MTDELITKIRHVLDRPIRNQMQVVYLLVELRKLLDREREKYNDPVLRTFSNWIVHTDLTRSGIEILAEFDELMASIFAGHKRPDHSHASLTEFRLSLLSCFKHFGLPTTLVTDAARWKRFCEEYCLVVSECPIVCEAPSLKLKYVRKAELRRLAPFRLFKRSVKAGPIQMAYWKITLKSGKTMDWGFNTGCFDLDGC